MFRFCSDKFIGNRLKGSQSAGYRVCRAFVGHEVDQDNISLWCEGLNRGAGKVYMKKPPLR